MFCFRIGTRLTGKEKLKPRHQTESWYLLGVLFKISDEHSSFLYGIPGNLIHLPSLYYQSFYAAL